MLGIDTPEFFGGTIITYTISSYNFINLEPIVVIVHFNNGGEVDATTFNLTSTTYD